MVGSHQSISFPSPARYKYGFVDLLHAESSPACAAHQQIADKLALHISPLMYLDHTLMINLYRVEIQKLKMHELVKHQSDVQILPTCFR